MNNNNISKTFSDMKLSQSLKIILVILIIFLIIDLPMITMLNSEMYQLQFKRINNSPMNVNLRTYISVGICYILLSYALYHFAVKQNSILNGALIGLIIYGVYNTTNLATINNFGIKESIVDTVWGTTLCTIVTYACIKIFN
jgi:uncharacterized membrane protein